MMQLTRTELCDVLTDYLAMFECHMESGIITWASHAMEAMFGHSMSGVLEGLYVEELMPAGVREKHANVYRAEYAANPVPRLMGKVLIVRGLRKDGSEFPVEVMLLPKAVSGRKVIVGIVFDLTARMAKS